MGAITFHDQIKTDLSVEAAYAAAVREALHENGHDPYNGTISTTSGVQQVNVAPMSYEAAMELAQERIEHLQKWEHCEAIPLLESTPEKREYLQPVTVTLEATEKELEDLRKHGVKSKFAKRMLKQIPDASGMLNYNATLSNIEEKVVAVTPKEKTVTRYFIVSGNKMPDWETGFASQALARAALKSLRRDGLAANQSGQMDVEIIAISRRESGAALVSATNTIKKATVTARVSPYKVARPATVGTKQIGWLMYGWAAY